MDAIKTKTRNITLCAVMISLATVLSLVPIYTAPFGGTVTLGSMVPLIIVCATLHDYRFGALTCFAYSLIQFLIGFAAPPTATVLSFIGALLLDYVVAFTVISVANPVSKLFKNEIFGVVAGSVSAMLLRFLCHFASGILIWSSLAPEGQPVWVYSLLYNGGYMLPELVITTVAASIICVVMKKRKA